MYILGINAYHGDASAAIIKDGELLAAVEEERFNRIKHCAGFPSEAVRYCQRAAGIQVEDIAHIGISRDPAAHLHKKVLFAATRAAKSSRRQEAGGRREETVGVAEIASDDNNGNGANGRKRTGLFAQIKDRLNNAAKVRDLKDDLAAALGVSASQFKAQFHNIEHHRAHLASSFYVSPFQKAALLSIDGFGDFISTMWGLGEGNSIRILDQVEYPHSPVLFIPPPRSFSGFHIMATKEK